MPEYTVTDGQGNELGRVRLDESNPSMEDIHSDEWAREELRETGCECFNIPEEADVVCATCQLLDGRESVEATVESQPKP